jgi:hypothetical protein
MCPASPSGPEAQQVLLFHHDPAHADEYLGALCGQVAERWIALGDAPGATGLAQEGRALAVRHLTSLDQAAS